MAPELYPQLYFCQRDVDSSQNMLLQCYFGRVSPECTDVSLHPTKSEALCLRVSADSFYGRDRDTYGLGDQDCRIRHL